MVRFRFIVKDDEVRGMRLEKVKLSNEFRDGEVKQEVV
jgi:hypothetical protein